MTKIDKLNQSELSRTKNEVKKVFSEMVPGQNLFVYSSVKKTGKKQLLQRLVKLD